MRYKILQRFTKRQMVLSCMKLEWTWLLRYKMSLLPVQWRKSSLSLLPEYKSTSLISNLHRLIINMKFSAHNFLAFTSSSSVAAWNGNVYSEEIAYMITRVETHVVNFYYGCKTE